MNDEPIFPRRVLLGWIGAAVALFAVSLYFMGSRGVGSSDRTGGYVKAERNFGDPAYTLKDLGHDGRLEFVTAVRDEPKLREMTLVMVTTESEQSHIVRALAAGAHEYVIKPFTSEAMIEKLALLGLVTTGANT